MNIFQNKNDLKNNNFFIFIPKTNKLVPLKIKINVNFEDLLEITEQKKIIMDNTVNLLNNKNSNNILLWGAKGMGKSTLVKSVVKHLNSTFKKKVKLIEVLNNNILDLVEIVYELSRTKYKCIIFIDDISFKNDDKEFKLFKSLVEGSLLSHVENVKYYITSNLRHLSHRDNKFDSNQLEEKESNQNLIALSDRFGAWVGFYDSNQKQYIKIVKYYLRKSSTKYTDEIEKLALRWSLEKGNFSGRTAMQFAYNFLNKKKVTEILTD